MNARHSPALLGHLQACLAGAALDNLFRAVVSVALVTAAAKLHLGNTLAAEKTANLYSNLATLLFMLPFVLLAPTAGSLGDRMPKHRIIRLARMLDVGLCVLGAVGLALDSVPLLLATIAGLGLVSAFFAPVKLAVIPELVQPKDLARANALVAAITVLAILGGTGLAAVTDADLISGSPLASLGSPGMLLLCSVLVAAIGVHGAWKVPPLVAQSPTAAIAKPWHLFRQLGVISSMPGIWAPALALAGFWSVGVAAQSCLAIIAQNVYGCGQAGTALLALILCFGIVAGALLAPRHIVRAFPAGLPIFGALVAGIGIFFAGLAAMRHHPQEAFASWLFVGGVGAGLWEVPLVVLLQERSPEKSRNALMASTGVVGSICMSAISALILALTQFAHFTSSEVLLVLGGLTCVIASACAWIYRHQVAGWWMAALLKLIYRVRVIGAENVPATGGCLIVCNHISYSDGAILAANLPRRGRFLVYRTYVDMPVIGFFLRAAGVIPVAAEDKRSALVASIDAAVTAAKAGEIVVIFPEGKLSRSGQLDTFRSGMERIAGRAGVPIVPAHLHGLWRTVLSRAENPVFPRPLRAVELRIGKPLPPDTTANEARQRILELSYQYAQAAADRDSRTLSSAFLHQAKRAPRHIAVRDAQGALSALQLAAVAISLRGKLDIAADEQCVGVLLPPSRAGAIVNLALSLAGKTAVNLNHTAGPAQISRMCELAKVRTVISADIYLRKIGRPELSAKLVLVEDRLKQLGKLRLVFSAAAVLLTPSRWLDRARAADTAALVFSSGSTGDPKGVQLNHRQIIANCMAIAHALDLRAGHDGIASPLPLFHSFGLIPGMWLGLILRLTVASHPDPNDGKGIGELAHACKSTMLLSTPTFVRGYLRRTEAEHFKSLRFAVAGAERCPADLRESFKERFGADLLEGYGCTELAPVACVNLPTVQRDGVVEVRTRDGSVGRPLPGMEIITIDAEAKTILPAGQEGLLVVRSASRMTGYLDRDDLTEKAFTHGGYSTGDIGRVDADGFVFITGRLARFAKIAGEMVPLDTIENVLHQHAGDAYEIAVTAVADPSRGERLVVLHTGFTGSNDDLLRQLDECPPLWRPKARDVHLVESIPKLGTGKRDLGSMKKLAAEKSSGGEQKSAKA
jgi:acyl-[acyl-carrier-protein]-phospholipid O-acyltransferase/long-chain-fatty-acid--[acyl-carrier-protein] ligase